MVGLGLTRLEPLRSYAASAPGTLAEAGGPPSGPFSVDSVRARAVEAARFVGDEGLASELESVCCWAPAMGAIRERPLALQERGIQYFFQDFPGGDQLAEVLHYTNNTMWRTPRFRFDPENLVSKHYELLRKPQTGVRTDVVTAENLNGEGRGELGLMLDRGTGDRLAQAADRSEPMWAALSIFSGALLDPTDDLGHRLTPLLSLRRTHDRALARDAAVTYSQIVLGATQRSVWGDLLDEGNAALPLVQLSSAGYLPLGERDGRFVLLQPYSGGSRLTGYRTSNA
jgi:hypothetical protein